MREVHPSRSSRLLSALTIPLLVAGAVSFLGAVPAANATEPGYCSTLGGSWDAATSICTFAGTYSANSGTLEITSGTLMLSASLSGSCSGPIQLTLSSTGSLRVDSGATLDIQPSFNCSTEGIHAGILLDGSGTGIVNYGTIEVDPVINCPFGSATPPICLGVLDHGAITNHGNLSIGGTYSCSAPATCAGIESVATGTVTDADCGTTSPTGSPYLIGNPVQNSGTCIRTGVALLLVLVFSVLALLVAALLVLRRRGVAFRGSSRPEAPTASAAPAC